MSSPAEVIARAVHDNDGALAPPYWDDCYPEMKAWYLDVGGKALAALVDAGWSLYRPEDAIKHAYEIGWCRKHDDMARRYDDSPDTYSCWWEDVVEASGEHDIRDFQPLRLVPVVEGENP